MKDQPLTKFVNWDQTIDDNEIYTLVKLGLQELTLIKFGQANMKFYELGSHIKASWVPPFSKYITFGFYVDKD